MTDPAPALAEITRVFGRIGVLSFGGPAAQIALMHRELVDRRGWLGERDFLSALSFCMLLPGPEAMQLATYCGWRLRGTAGGLIAGGLFVAPGALLVGVLAWAYAAWGAQPWAGALFLGIKAAVVVIVAQALVRLSRRALLRPWQWMTAAAAFIGIFLLALPFPAIVAAAALAGALAGGAAAVDRPPPRPRATGLGRTLALWGGLWAAPVLGLWAAGASFLTEIALFFSKLAVVTFGGAYAVLAYMVQEVVTERGWIDAGQMIDALGLAETTPGPLILVTQFVAFLAGHGAGGPGLALAAAAVALWVTFVPCFLWIFAGAPWLAWVTAQPRAAGALAGITAAVVGVILSLALWFAAHTAFSEVGIARLGPLELIAPVWSSVSVPALALAALAALLLLFLRWPLPLVIALSAGAGLALAG